jgi:hypothetical protein
MRARSTFPIFQKYHLYYRKFRIQLANPSEELFLDKKTNGKKNGKMEGIGKKYAQNLRI